ncbi:MAG: DUF2334 domain-containing protein [Chloroflexota bacterium]
MTKKRFIISLHDVAPPFENEIRAQLDALARIHVHRCALKVVPNWHGAYPLPAARSLIDLLRAQHEGGSELILHGLEHRRRGALRGPLRLRLRGALFAGDAAEFLTLSAPELLRSVRWGRELFERADLPVPSTFCAPGWLVAPGSWNALTEAGIRHVIGMFTVYDLERSRRRYMPAVGYMGASPVHEAGIRLGNRLAWLASSHSTIVKIYLHPRGGAQGEGFRRVLAGVMRLIEEGWQPATYEQVFRPDPEG